MKNETKEEFNSGALLDTRSEAEKAKDFRFEELTVSANPVVWTEKAPTSWRKFPIFNQNGSGSCVAQSLAKMMGILYLLKNAGNYVHFSATHLYQRRSNKPSGGMAGVDAFEIAKKGVTLESLAPSQSLTDNQMDSFVVEKYKQQVGEIFKIGNYIVGPTRDIETVASIIQTTGKPVMVWYYFNHDEWINIPTISRTIDLYAPSTSRHSVTAVDFTLFNGKKCLIIDDSWGPGFGQGGQRIITEDFHSVRNFFVGHTMNFGFDNPVTPPVALHNFTKNMKQGDRNNDVRELQLLLNKLGHYPNNIAITGYFGSITKASVIKFQLSRNLVGDGVIGSLSLAELNK